MTLLIATALAAAAAPQASACPATVTPETFVCRALDAQRRGAFDEGARAFEEAAKASSDKDIRKPRLLAAAGNLWISAGQAGKAAFDLDQALALPGLEADQRGEALLDRARAAEAQGDLKTARAKVGEAGQTISADPFYWYFSAALAIREGDPASARTAINKALALAPNDPTVLFEAGHVADLLGHSDEARSYWMRAAEADHGEIGKAAAKAVEMLGVTPVVKLDAPAPK